LKVLGLHPLVVFTAGVAVLPPVVTALGSTIGLATEILVTILFALAFNFLLGYTGQLSFGHAAYYGIGAYTAALVQLKLWPTTLGGVLLAPVVSGLAAAAVGALIIRKRGIYFSLLTLAFAQLFYFIVFEWRDFTGGEFGMGGIARVPVLGIPIDPDLAYYALVAACVVPATAVLWRIVDSPFGRTLQAIRDNEQRASCVGYNARLYKFLGFVISGAVAGLAGGLSAFIFRYISVDLLHWSASGFILMMTLIGGSQTFFGPAVGAFIFVLAKDLLSSRTEHWMIPFGLIFVLFVLFAPQGIGGWASAPWARRRWRSAGTADVAPTPAPAGRTAARAPTPPPAPLAPGTVVLAANGLTIRFGALAAVNGASIEARVGEIHSVIGPNGAGKTTLFNLLTGVLRPVAGRVTLAGRDVTDQPAYVRARAGLARSFQLLSVFKTLSALENVRVAVQAAGGRGLDLVSRADDLPGLVEQARGLLAEVGLEGHAARRADTLAHGDRRLLEIAIALATRPAVLLLDEPLAGLPDAERGRIVALVRRLADRYAVLLIEHDIDRVLEISDRITAMHEGHVIASGTPEQIQENALVQQAYLGRGAAGQAAPGSRAATPARAPLLVLEGVHTAYGSSEVLHDVSLTVGENEMACLLGRNGVGKTTTLRTIMGVAPPRRGRILLDGHEIHGLAPHQAARLGIAIVPEGARVFPNLTVIEHMQMAVRHGRPGRWTIPRVLELLPKLHVLRQHRGEHLSGGERKMLAIARGLLANPRLLLLDEPLEGLAPAVVDGILEVLSAMRGEMAVLLVEQKAGLVLPLCESAFILNNGAVAYRGHTSQLLENEALLGQLLGV
jgi:ABC-type branched-subunit amino acid transport system ATPase component/ABC-type branched-subunit amino acid transport system permease subunit